MLEQEMASIIHFIRGQTTPTYYDMKIPEGFDMPSVYFPPPEVDSSASSLSTYKLTYIWFVKFFAPDEVESYNMAFNTLEAIRRRRNLIPFIDEAGERQEGRLLRLHDPVLNPMNDTPEATQLTITWDSYRPYDTESSQKARIYHLNMYAKAAYEAALSIIEEETHG